MTDAIRHNKKVNLLAFLSILSFLSSNLWAKTVEIKGQSCHYRIELPTLWDTIPQSLLREKIGVCPIDIALYPTTQQDCFSGNYVLINFLPVAKSLNNYTLDHILEEVKSEKPNFGKDCIIKSLFIGELLNNDTNSPLIVNSFKICKKIS